MSYTPLDSGTIFSSVMWLGPDVVGVWYAILASKDQDGMTPLNPRALAALFRCDVERVQAAWDKLAAPDPESNNRDREGRRIVQMPDGRWWVVSSDKYREKHSGAMYRTSAALRKQRQRQREAAGRDGAAGVQAPEPALGADQGPCGVRAEESAPPPAAPSLPHDLRPGPRVTVVNGLTGERRPLEEAFEPHPEIPTPAVRLAIERECGELVLEIVRLERPEVDNLAVVMSATEWRGDSKTRLDRLSNERLLHTRVRLRERAARARAAAAKAEEEARVIEHYRQQREEKGA